MKKYLFVIKIESKICPEYKDILYLYIATDNISIAKRNLTRHFLDNDYWVTSIKCGSEILQ